MQMSKSPSLRCRYALEHKRLTCGHPLEFLGRLLDLGIKCFRGQNREQWRIWHRLKTTLAAHMCVVVCQTKKTIAMKILKSWGQSIISWCKVKGAVLLHLASWDLDVVTDVVWGPLALSPGPCPSPSSQGFRLADSSQWLHFLLALPGPRSTALLEAVPLPGAGP